MQQEVPEDSGWAGLAAHGPAPAPDAPDAPDVQPRERPRTRNARRLAVEHAVAGVLAGTADIPEAATRVVRTLCEELGWRCGACWVRGAAVESLSCVGHWGEDDPAIDAFRVATRAIPADAAGQDLVRWVLSAGEPVWLGDVAQEPGFACAAQAARAGLHRALAFPISAGGRTLGAVELFGGSMQPLDAEWLDSARYIGRQIGQFLLRAQAQAALQANQRLYAETIERAAIGIAHVDEAGRFVHANGWLCGLLGYSRDELLGMAVQQTSHPDDLHVTDGVRARLRAGEIDSFEVEKRYLRKDGDTVWVHLTVAVQRDTAGRALHDIAIFQDISARKRAECALQRSEQRFRNLVELSSDWYWELDAELRFTAFGGRHMGDKYDELLRGRLAWEIPGADEGGNWTELRTRLQQREPFRDFEYAYSSRHGQRRFVSVSGEPMLDAEGRFAGYRGVSRDVTARKQAEERVQYLATHDSLTGLPNRATFAELLGHVLAQARRHQRRAAVLFIDLDGFKRINDSLGHDAGDALLVEVAHRLKDGSRSSDVVARLGGDEFVMLLQDLRGGEEAGSVARKLLAALSGPIAIDGRVCSITASVGISLFPDDAADEAGLMTHADRAMYHAKQAGKNNFRFYDGR